MGCYCTILEGGKKFLHEHGSELVLKQATPSQTRRSARKYNHTPMFPVVLQQQKKIRKREFINNEFDSLVAK